jgi:hypothetical protein
MKIAPVSPIPPLNNSGSPRYFSQNHTNKETNMSNNNTDTITISESSEDKDTTVTIPLQFKAKLGVPQELIDEGNRALRRFKWTLITIVGGYIALNILAAYLQVSS